MSSPNSRREAPAILGPAWGLVPLCVSLLLACASQILVISVAVLTALLCFFHGSGVWALEKTEIRVPTDMDQREWLSGTTCLVSYYNICTGWIWVDYLEAEMRVGVAFDPCCDSAVLQSTAMYIHQPIGCQPGWGFTSTVTLHEADMDDCPVDPALDTQTWIPCDNGWNVLQWNVPVPDRFVVVYEAEAWGFRTAMAYEHPTAGPTGPQACGLCYPSTRSTHSYYFGFPSAPLCPGSPVNDGVCDAEWLWVAGLECPTSLRSSSWANIKALYR